MSVVPTLHVRNVPSEVYEALRARATGEGRSINATVIAILEENIVRPNTGEEIARRLEAMASRFKLPAGAPDPVDVIREHRDAGL
jgi:plasmid stability protein